MNMERDNLQKDMLKKILKNQNIQNHIKEVDDKESISEKIKVLILGLIIGIAYDYFFVGESIGVSMILFNSLFIGFSIWIVYSKVDLSNKLSWMFLLPSILLSLTYVIYDNPLLRLLNIIAIPLLISGYILSIRYESIEEINISFIRRILNRLITIPLENFNKGAKFTKEIIKLKNKNKENPVRKAVFRGLIISIPLLVVILSLLASADAMFSYHIKNIGNIFGYINMGESIFHILFILFIATYSIGFLWSLKYNEEIDNTENKLQDKYKLNAITVLTVLLSISIVYLLFSIIQISYLYGDSENIIKSGFTYAEYARRGFFELVLVTLINFTILILSISFTKVDGRKIAITLKILYSLLIVFTFNMIFSSFYKMNLYEEALGYTRLRVLVQIFIVYLGVLLSIVLFRVWREKLKTLKLALIVSMVFYVGVNFANIDKLIVKNNIDRYFETGNIDIYYITSLSCDAIDEMKRLLEIEGNVVAKNQYSYINPHEIDENSEIENISIKEIAKIYINEKQENLNKYYDKWYEYNYYKKKTQEFKFNSK